MNVLALPRNRPAHFPNDRSSAFFANPNLAESKGSSEPQDTFHASSTPSNTDVVYQSRYTGRGALSKIAAISALGLAAASCPATLPLFAMSTAAAAVLGAASGALTGLIVLGGNGESPGLCAGIGATVGACIEASPFLALTALSSGSVSLACAAGLLFVSAELAAIHAPPILKTLADKSGTLGL